jgi:hypothetical protein
MKNQMTGKRIKPQCIAALSINIYLKKNDPKLERDLNDTKGFEYRRITTA